MAEARTSKQLGEQLGIRAFLGRVRVLVYRHEARRASLSGIALLGALALALPLIGQLTSVGGVHRTAAMAILGTGGLVAMLVVLGAIVIGWVAPRRTYARDQDLARWVGRRHGAIASDLLSAVELANAPERPGAPSADLVDALIETTEVQLVKIAPATLLPWHGMEAATVSTSPAHPFAGNDPRSPSQIGAAARSPASIAATRQTAGNDSRSM